MVKKKPANSATSAERKTEPVPVTIPETPIPAILPDDVPSLAIVTEEPPRILAADEVKPFGDLPEPPATNQHVSAAIEAIARTLYESGGAMSADHHWYPLQYLSEPEFHRITPRRHNLGIPRWAYEWGAYKLLRERLLTATERVLPDKVSQDLGVVSVVLHATHQLFKLWFAGNLSQTVASTEAPSASKPASKNGKHAPTDEINLPQYMTAKEIADHLGKPVKATHARLSRLADKHDCRNEREGRRVREAKWEYHVRTVLALLRSKD